MLRVSRFRLVLLFALAIAMFLLLCGDSQNGKNRKSAQSITLGAGDTRGCPPTDAVNATVNLRGSEALGALITDVYDKLDPRGVGSFTLTDVDRAMLAPCIKGRHAIALVVVRDNFTALAGGKERLTLGDLQGYTPGVVRSNLADSIDWRFATAENFLKNVNRGLFPRGTLAESCSKMRSVEQVQRGNCYLLSGIGSVSAQTPEVIRNCFTDNGVDTARGIRTYSIRFPRDRAVEYVVEDFTDAALLFAEVSEDSGTWVAVLTRAFGQYMKDHAHVRIGQRLFYKLDKRVLLEDATDHGGIDSEGLRMLTDPRVTELKRVLWGFPDEQVNTLFKEILDGMLPDANPMIKTVLTAALLPQVKSIIKSMCVPRDESVVHDLLMRSVADNKLPATVIKHGGAHEASIIGYEPGTKTADGKHESKYGFVTIRDQAGLYEPEEKNVTDGKWWRNPGMDGKTVVMTVEEFTAIYCGFNVVLKR